MIISRLLNALSSPRVEVNPLSVHSPQFLDSGVPTTSGQKVSVERSRNVAVIYAAANIISDDIAKMPLQTFISRRTGEIERVKPDPVIRNHAYLNEVAPNRWMTPFIFKKAVALWMFFWGNAYIWTPPGTPRERYILAANVTQPVFEAETGELWYETYFPNQPLKPDYIPAAEILHLMMNSSDGYVGKSMITYARETIGRQLGAYETQDKFYADGLNPAMVAWVRGDPDKAVREKIRRSYSEAISGSGRSHRMAVIGDGIITKLEPITMKPVDAQFLQSIEATDRDLANFARIPLHMLNMGKQAYRSNEQKYLEYLTSTLDPYLVQWEQGAAAKWLRAGEQGYTYFRFERNALLRTDAKTRAEYLGKMVTTGQMSPNEARQVNDMPAFEGGNRMFFPVNMQEIGETNE